MAVTTAILFVAGLVLLVGGAEVMVRGASRLATTLGVSPLVVGLTLALVFALAAPWALAIVALAGLLDIFVDFRKWALPPEAREGR